MKKLLLISFAACAVGCATNKTIPCPPCPDNVVDLVMVHDTVCDPATMLKAAKADSLFRVIDSMDNRIKKYADNLALANLRIERVKKYLNICLRNPTQDKFLKGWIRRAVE